MLRSELEQGLDLRINHAVAITKPQNLAESAKVFKKVLTLEDNRRIAWRYTPTQQIQNNLTKIADERLPAGDKKTSY